MTSRLWLFVLLAWPLPALAAIEPCTPARAMCGPLPEALVVCQGGHVASVHSVRATGVLLAVGATCATDEGEPINRDSAVASWSAALGMAMVGEIDGGRLSVDDVSPSVPLGAGLGALQLPFGDCMARMDELSDHDCVGGLTCAASAQPGQWHGFLALGVGGLLALGLARRRGRAGRISDVGKAALSTALPVTANFADLGGGDGQGVAFGEIRLGACGCNEFKDFVG